MLTNHYDHVKVITAENMVSQLANLTNLTSFGYTLNGGVDVDNNKYRGRVCGDHVCGTFVSIGTWLCYVHVSMHYQSVHNCCVFHTDLIVGAYESQAVFVLR